MHRILSRAHRDEEGTAITEFVITLPVFVLSFVAILNLHGISEFAVQGKGTAYARALGDFKEVQTDWIPADWAVSPVSAGIEAGVWHNKVSQSRPRDRAADLVLDPVPIGTGHMAESYSRLLISGPPDWTAETVELDPPKAHMTMESLMNTVSKSPVTGEVRYGPEMNGAAGSVFAKDLNNDLVDISGLGGGQKDWMGFVNGFLTTAGARPALGAGMRYGVTTGGEFDEARTFMRTTYQIQTSTHIAVPPRPTDKWLSTAIIRAYLASDQAYDEYIPAFQMDLNTSSPEAQAAQDCATSLSEISITDPTTFDDALDVLGNIEGGDPCGTGAGVGGSGNPLDFIIGPLSNAAGFFGGPVPTDTTTGNVPSTSPF